MLDIDTDLENADWTKQTWDLPCETPEELADYLEMAGIDPVLFAELPVMQAAPWLTDDELDDSLLGDTITAGGPMPWHKAKDHNECGSSRPWAVVSSKDGKVMGCHASEEAANSQLAALYASESDKGMTAAHKQAIADEFGEPVAPEVDKLKSMGEEIGAMDKAGQETVPEPEAYSPSDEERDSYDSGFAEAEESLALGATPEEVEENLEEDDPAYADGVREAIAYHREKERAVPLETPPAERKPGQPRSNEEAFAKAVPLATDKPTRPGQVVKAFDVNKERADIDRRVKAGELTTAEGQMLTEQAWAEHERRKERNLTASAAGMVPLAPPAEWFDDPKLEHLTPLEVTADGQVRGHLAGWDTCHIGDPRGPGVCVSPPSSKTDYGFFHLGQVLAADGRKVPVGQITLDTGHAPLGMNARTAAAHYDHTGTAVADVRAGEDKFGIWVAGALRPHVSAEKARSLTAAKLSGDWRGIQGNLEMVGVLAVNVPGFPVPRPEVRLVASGEPETRAALVAAGILETVDPIVPEARREAMLARILGRDALLAAALPRVLRRPQPKKRGE